MHEKNYVPVSEAVVQLTLLGDFDFRVGSHNLTLSLGQSLKLRSILCYLILSRDRLITREELIEVFYSDEAQSNPAGALKMQILRIKRSLAAAFGDDCHPIISHRGAYQWNPEISCWVDTEYFEQLIDQADNHVQSESCKLDMYKQALSVYQGGFILEKDGLLWSKTLASKFHTKYVSLAERYLSLLDAAGKYFEMENCCLRSVEIAPLSEEIHTRLIQALFKQKKYAEARKRYKVVESILYKELGVQPAEELQQLYAQCCSEEKPWEQDLSLVLDSMRDLSEEPGAFLCSYEQFKSIYQLEVRRAQRNGSCLHIAMLTVLTPEHMPQGTKTNTNLMDRVLDTILSHLRQSDVVARYGNQQFLIMLPHANQEDSYLVIERIIRAYRIHNPSSTVRFTYQIRELELIP